MDCVILCLCFSGFGCKGISVDLENGFWFGLMFKVPVNNFSVMLGRSHRFLGITSTFFFFFFFWGGGV